ncbi:VapE domain-containing protein [Emticicia soli]|uniref:VapE domain-containing protein n=1 Tax=Emticicia soli TaxID=2027878 RepID=A0ABW5J8J7_9BACT
MTEAQEPAILVDVPEKKIKDNKKFKGRLSKRQKIEDSLSEYYDFRYNYMKYKIEFSPKFENNFKEITDRDIHTILRILDRKTDHRANFADISSIIHSDFSKTFNPIEEYFLALSKTEKFDQKNLEMDKLIACVTCKTQPEFAETLKRWLIASVANAISPIGCQNQICMVLIGDQGAYKTTFLNALCPKPLHEYLYSGKLNLESKDTWIMLGQFFIINIDDQLKVLHKKDAETMKTLITQKELSLRLPHDKYNTKIMRRANFCGSINGLDFLTDNTGNRRFLPFEILDIDIDRVQTKINLNRVWLEAYTMYLHGTKYWFDKDEIEKLFGDFSDFTTASPEQELFLKYFEPYFHIEELPIGGCSYMTNTDILQYLNARVSGLNLSGKKLGEILSKLKVLKIKKSVCGISTQVYVMREREPENVKLESRLMPEPIKKPVTKKGEQVKLLDPDYYPDPYAKPKPKTKSIKNQNPR